MSVRPAKTQISLIRVFAVRIKKVWVLSYPLRAHYKVNNYPLIKNKPIYHAQNVNRWKGLSNLDLSIDLLILDVINRFILVMG